MATITTEFGKVSSKKQRAVYLLVRDKKTVKRIATGVKVDENEISPKTKKIKNFEKAQIVEKLKMELVAKMTSLGPEYHYNDSVDASKIASKIVSKKQAHTIDFFSFAELWISRRESKSMRNYVCMLHKFQEFLKRDTLDFSEITYTLLMDFENYLSDFTRAKSMYLGEIRHLYREAMLEYNTDEETIIKNDPFMRYKAFSFSFFCTMPMKRFIIASPLNGRTSATNGITMSVDAVSAFNVSKPSDGGQSINTYSNSPFTGSNSSDNIRSRAIADASSNSAIES